MRASFTQKSERKDLRKNYNFILKDRWPLSRGSFTHKYEWKSFRNIFKGVVLVTGFTYTEI